MKTSAEKLVLPVEASIEPHATGKNQINTLDLKHELSWFTTDGITYGSSVVNSLPLSPSVRRVEVQTPLKPPQMDLEQALLSLLLL